MKKRALAISIGMMIICHLINHYTFSSRFFGLIFEIEKLVVMVVIAIFCYYFIQAQAKITMYSYSLMSNLGVLYFLLNAIVFQLYRLLFGFDSFTLNDIYETIIDAFAIHVWMMMPFALMLAVMLVISNVVLIKKEGYRLSNMLGIALGSLLVLGSIIAPNLYTILDELIGDHSRFVDGLIYFFEAEISLIIAYFECMMVGVIICTLKSERYQPPFNQNFLIILGCKVGSDRQPLPILQGRLDRALAFAGAQKQALGPAITYIPSGGQGSDEVISEAQAMKNYLLAQGVSTYKIITENKSKTTRENMAFSKKIIDQQQGENKVVFVTTGYHVWRSGVIANTVGLKAVGIGAKAPWYFYNNALIREFIANLYVQRLQHLFNLIWGTISIVIMLVAGYQLGII